MSGSNQRQEPEQLDAHRGARGKRAAASATDAGGNGQSPTSFEEAHVVKRARRIEQLREIVESGDYRPDPGQIAESMLENERS